MGPGEISWWLAYGIHAISALDDTWSFIHVWIGQYLEGERIWAC